MIVAIGISENKKIIGTFEMKYIPNVGELIFDKIKSKHFKVEEKVFNIYNGDYLQAIDITLWCKEV